MEENPPPSEILQVKSYHPLVVSPTPFSINPRISLHTPWDIPKILKAQNKHLIRLAFMLSWGWNPKNSALMRYCDKNKKNLHWLKRFSLEAYYGTQFTQNQIINIVKSLKTVQSLTHFKVAGKIMHQDHLIIPLLRNFKRLQYLTLDFHNSRDADLPSIEKTFVSLKDLSRLKVIKIAFGSLQGPDDRMIKEIGLGVSRLRTLKGLCVELGQKYWGSDAGIGDVFSNWRTYEPALILSFPASRKDISNQIFENIIINLKSLPRLEKFELETGYYTDITDQGLDKLAVWLPQRLQSLRLDFNTCQKVTKEGVLNLLSAIAKKCSLQDISLMLSSENQIDDEVTKELLRCLNRQKGLESLFIGFDKCNMITKSALTRFLTFIPLNSNLKSLALSLTWLKKNLTDESLTKFGIALAKLKGLKALRLSFRGCNEVSNKGINDLAMKFGCLERLRKFALNFQNCPSIRGKISDNLFKGLEKLKDLEILTLDLRHCKHLDKNEIQKIIPSSKSQGYKFLVRLE